MFLKILLKIHKYLLGALLVLIILSLEVLFVDILPLIDGRILFIMYLVLSLLFVLFYIILLLVGLPWALFNRKRVAAAGLPHRYGLQFVGGVLAWLLCLVTLAFQPYHSVEVVNETDDAIDNLRLDASFRKGASEKLVGSVGANKSASFIIKSLEDFEGLTLDRKLFVKFLQGGKEKWRSKKSSFLKTTMIIGDFSPSNPLEMNCDENVFYHFTDKGYEMTVDMNLCRELMEEDTTAISYLSNSPISYIVLKTPFLSRIKKVERVLDWYPSIWSELSADLLQFTKLDGLKYQTVDELKVLSFDEERDLEVGEYTFGNVIAYENPYRADYDLSCFKNISKEDVMKHLVAELNNPDSYRETSADQKQQWIDYLDDYSEGDFLDDDKGLFRVDYFDIYLRVTFEGDDADFVKVLHNWVHVGN